ncbi:hypothetical protein [Brevundimonas sp.]|uniref:hypothetical protein n=1 Tax=Brevundimonas sp. TaxID=1871086 RepID=UPI002625135F|nr:hypothetical protein [Brevundimonas sp.]
MFAIFQAMETDQQKGERLARLFEGMTEQARDEFTARQLAATDRQHIQFRDAFRQGICYLCDERLDHFQERKPCVHWLLRPLGFRKKHLPAMTAAFGMMQTQSWLRWVASEGAFARNITDTAEENGYVVQITIRYDVYQWSISCGKSDFAGHGNQNFPHYHLQMWIDGRPFISYGDFHIRLHSDEVAALTAIQATGGMVKSKFPHGESFEDLVASTTAEWVIDAPVGEGDHANAPFNISTVMIAKPGTTMSGDDLYAMFTKARASKVTIASLAREFPDAVTESVVSPGPGVVEPAVRTPLRRTSKGQAD